VDLVGQVAVAVGVAADAAGRDEALDLRWRALAEAQKESRRRVSERDTAAERREAAAGRAAFWICVLAAAVLAARGTWWLALVVAGWWLVGLAYFAWRVVPG
jgi:hypothetical protein